MADDRLRFILDFVAQTSGLKNAQALAEELGTSLEDAEDAGKAMAAALKVGADKAQRELDETVKMADKLADALGPELAGKVNVDEIATQMRTVGMTTADVEANIDDFRSSLTQMAATADQAKARLGDMDDGVRRVGDTADRSRSVMANFTGNALQEVPLMTGAFGPLNMAIGQFGEYAAEGNISMKGLAAAAGPIALVSLVMGALSKKTDEAKKHAEGLKAAQDALADGRAEEAARKMGETFNGVYNFAESLGLSIDDVTLALMGNEAAFERINYAMNLHANTLQAGTAEQVAFYNQQVNMQAMLSEGAKEWQNLGGATAETEARVASIIPVMERAALTTGKTKDAADALRVSWDNLTGAVSGELDFEDAVYGMQQALDTLNNTTDDGTTLVDEHAQALTGAKQQALDTAAAYEEQQRKAAELNGTTYTTGDAMRDQAAALQLVADGLAPGSDLRVWLEQYIAQLERAKSASILPGGSRTGEGARNGNNPAVPGRASGGPVTAGQAYVVGEKRPELFVPGMSGTILPSVPGAGGGTNVTINVSVAPGANLAEVGRQTADALAAFYRNGGQRP